MGRQLTAGGGNVTSTPAGTSHANAGLSATDYPVPRVIWKEWEHKKTRQKHFEKGHFQQARCPATGHIQHSHYYMQILPSSFASARILILKSYLKKQLKANSCFTYGTARSQPLF